MAPTAFVTVMGTALLLASALATYDLILQLATVLNVFGSAATKPIPTRSLVGQAVFAFALGALAIFFLYCFPISDVGVVGERRGFDLSRQSAAAADATGFVH